LTSFEKYFVQGASGRWLKAGIVTSIAKKNPLENADGLARRGHFGVGLLKSMEAYARTVELRTTGDDLPRYDTRVDLDPAYVDEYGLPVARITRRMGPHELEMEQSIQGSMRGLFEPLAKLGVDLNDPDQFSVSGTDVRLFGDHQMGTCRMGDNPEASVTDRYCRLHDVRNVFVVDTSFMPTGLGVNPMVTVMSNALRVGSWIVEELARGRPIS
jgi:choline dehydrogenase-like flavoprotein